MKKKITRKSGKKSEQPKSNKFGTIKKFVVPINVDVYACSTATSACRTTTSEGTTYCGGCCGCC